MAGLLNVVALCSVLLIVLGSSTDDVSPRPTPMPFAVGLTAAAKQFFESVRDLIDRLLNGQGNLAETKQFAKSIVLTLAKGDFCDLPAQNEFFTSVASPSGAFFTNSLSNEARARLGLIGGAFFNNLQQLFRVVLSNGGNQTETDQMEQNMAAHVAQLVEGGGFCNLTLANDFADSLNAGV